MQTQVQQPAHREVIKLRTGKQIAGDRLAHNPQREGVPKPKGCQRLALTPIGGHRDGKFTAALGVGAQAGVQQFFHHAAPAQRGRSGHTGKPEPATAPAFHRDRGKHGRHSGAVAGRVGQQQNIFQPRHLLQPIDRLGAICTEGFGAQRGQAFKVGRFRFAQHCAQPRRPLSPIGSFTQGRPAGPSLRHESHRRCA